MTTREKLNNEIRDLEKVIESSTAARDAARLKLQTTPAAELDKEAATTEAKNDYLRKRGLLPKES